MDNWDHQVAQAAASSEEFISVLENHPEFEEAGRAYSEAAMRWVVAMKNAGLSDASIASAFAWSTADLLEQAREAAQ